MSLQWCLLNQLPPIRVFTTSFSITCNSSPSFAAQLFSIVSVWRPPYLQGHHPIVLDYLHLEPTLPPWTSFSIISIWSPPYLHGHHPVVLDYLHLEPTLHPWTSPSRSRLSPFGAHPTSGDITQSFSIISVWSPPYLRGHHPVVLDYLRLEPTLPPGTSPNHSQLSPFAPSP